MTYNSNIIITFVKNFYMKKIKKVIDKVEVTITGHGKKELYIPANFSGVDVMAWRDRNKEEISQIEEIWANQPDEEGFFKELHEHKNNIIPKPRGTGRGTWFDLVIQLAKKYRIPCDDKGIPIDLRFNKTITKEEEEVI
jgi:hypothetical protein